MHMRSRLTLTRYTNRDCDDLTYPEGRIAFGLAIVLGKEDFGLGSWRSSALA